MFYFSPVELSLQMFYSCLHLSKVGHFPFYFFFESVRHPIESEVMFLKSAARCLLAINFIF
jgi:hypothetical protein